MSEIPAVGVFPSENEVAVQSKAPVRFIIPAQLINASKKMILIIKKPENRTHTINASENIKHNIKTSENLTESIKTSGNVMQVIETSENVMQVIETSENVMQVIETSGNIRQNTKTSENITQAHYIEKSYGFPCPKKCGKKFSHRSSLYRHTRKPCDIDGGFPCRKKCGKTFAHKSSMYQHMKSSCTNRREKKSFICEKCHVWFKSNQTYQNHSKICNPSASSTKYTECIHPECNAKFYLVKQMVEHLEEFHSQDAGVKNFNFHNKEEFLEWKQKEERENFVSFVIMTGPPKKGGGMTHNYYKCNFNQRPRKGAKSGRITNFNCFARIATNERKDGTLSVKYISSHSHPTEPSNLKFHRYRKETYDYIKTKLIEGVSLKAIQEHFRPPDDDTASLPQKEHFITLKELSDTRYRLKQQNKLCAAKNPPEMTTDFSENNEPWEQELQSTENIPPDDTADHNNMLNNLDFLFDSIRKFCTENKCVQKELLPHILDVNQSLLSKCEAIGQKRKAQKRKTPSRMPRKKLPPSKKIKEIGTTKRK